MFVNVHFWTEISFEMRDDCEVTPPAAKHEARSVVAEYRFYFLDEGRNISGPADIEQFDEDAAAVAKARNLLEDQIIEVWQGARRVAVLTPDLPKR